MSPFRFAALAVALQVTAAHADEESKVILARRQAELAPLVSATADQDYYGAIAASACNLNIARLCEVGRRGEVSAQGWVSQATDLLRPSVCETFWAMFVAKFKAADQVIGFVDKHPSDGNEIIAAFNSVLLGTVTEFRGSLPETVNAAAKKSGCIVERVKATRP